MLLNVSFSSQKIFRKIYTVVYRSDRDCHTKLRGGGASIAVSGAKLTSDFEYFKQYGRNLLIDNYYFIRDIKVNIIKNYFNF
jgi:hypothetical protein